MLRVSGAGDLVKTSDAPSRAARGTATSRAGGSDGIGRRARNRAMAGEPTTAARCVGSYLNWHTASLNICMRLDEGSVRAT